VFKIIKLLIYAAILALVVSYFWALPKLNFVKEHPGFCTQLTKNLYYCGDAADVKAMFQVQK
jgi:hypothetical protein